MQPPILRSRIHKAELAVLIAAVGVITTTLGVVFALVDDVELITPFWIGCACVAGLGMFLCYRWQPTQRALAAALHDTWGIWSIFIAFALFDENWHEVVAFSIVLIAVLSSSAWLKRSPLRTDHRV